MKGKNERKLVMAGWRGKVVPRGGVCGGRNSGGRESGVARRI